MFALLTKSRRLCLPIDVILDLFDKIVLPILLYGCEIWGHTDINGIEVFYRNFIRRILKLGNSTSNGMLYGETGKTSIMPTIEKRMIAFWLRLVQGSQNKLSVILYQFVSKLYNVKDYQSLWFKKIVSMLQDCGMYYIWRNQEENLDIKHITMRVNMRINDIWLQKWNSRVNSAFRCTYYKLFKEEHTFENYLLMDDKHIINMAKFRCRHNHLPISKNIA